MFTFALRSTYLVTAYMYSGMHLNQLHHTSRALLVHVQYTSRVINKSIINAQVHNELIHNRILSLLPLRTRIHGDNSNFEVYRQNRSCLQNIPKSVYDVKWTLLEFTHFLYKKV